MSDHIATARTEISASPTKVWAALTKPELIKEYMFGSQVETDWRPGSAIVWKGEYEGKAYEDRGKILEITPEKRLQVTHFSPLGGKADVPENYHTLTYEIDSKGDTTTVLLSQDNNASVDEAEHSEAMWKTMLEGLKEVAERT